MRASFPADRPSLQDFATLDRDTPVEKRRFDRQAQPIRPTYDELNIVGMLVRFLCYGAHLDIAISSRFCY